MTFWPVQTTLWSYWNFVTAVFRDKLNLNSLTKPELLWKNKRVKRPKDQSAREQY
jgi:hypothetical protein